MCHSRRSRRSELLSKSAQSLHQKQQQQQKSLAALRATEQILVDRCPECNAVLESYDEETISLAIVCLATFIHREPGLAAPCLLDMLITVARYGEPCVRELVWGPYMGVLCMESHVWRTTCKRLNIGAMFGESRTM